MFLLFLDCVHQIHHQVKINYLLEWISLAKRPITIASQSHFQWSLSLSKTPRWWGSWSTMITFAFMPHFHFFNSPKRWIPVHLNHNDHIHLYVHDDKFCGTPQLTCAYYVCLKGPVHLKDEVTKWHSRMKYFVLALGAKIWHENLTWGRNNSSFK